MVGTDDLLKVRGNSGFFFWVIEVCICWNESFGVLDFIFLFFFLDSVGRYRFALRFFSENLEGKLGSLPRVSLYFELL